MGAGNSTHDNLPSAGAAGRRSIVGRNARVRRGAKDTDSGAAPKMVMKTARMSPTAHGTVTTMAVAAAVEVVACDAESV